MVNVWLPDTGLSLSCGLADIRTLDEQYTAYPKLAIEATLANYNPNVYGTAALLKRFQHFTESFEKEFGLTVLEATELPAPLRVRLFDVQSQVTALEYLTEVAAVPPGFSESSDEARDAEALRIGAAEAELDPAKMSPVEDQMSFDHVGAPIAQSVLECAEYTQDTDEGSAESEKCPIGSQSVQIKGESSAMATVTTTSPPAPPQPSMRKDDHSAKMQEHHMRDDASDMACSAFAYHYPKADCPPDEATVYMNFMESPNGFWLMMVEKQSVLAEILGGLLDDYEGPLPMGFIGRERVRVGTACACRFRDDECWYRAEIKSIAGTGSTAVVQFVDYGNTQRVTLEEIKPLVKKYATPPLVYACRLSGLDERVRLSDGDRHVFQEILQQVGTPQFLCRFITKATPPYDVILYHPETKESLNVLFIDALKKHMGRLQ
jgi:hypothetical protein